MKPGLARLPAGWPVRAARHPSLVHLCTDLPLLLHPWFNREYGPLSYPVRVSATGLDMLLSDIESSMANPFAARRIFPGHRPTEQFSTALDQAFHRVQTVIFLNNADKGTSLLWYIF